MNIVCIAGFVFFFCFVSGCYITHKMTKDLNKQTVCDFSKDTQKAIKVLAYMITCVMAFVLCLSYVFYEKGIV